MDLIEREKYTDLFDRYQGLLTQTQRQALQLYLFEDLGISEIATEVATSRQAVNDAIRKGMKRLDEIKSKMDY